MKKIRRFLTLYKKEFLVLLLLCVFAVPSIISLLHPGYFKTDDGHWMVIRFSGFLNALRDGQFPVRFLTQLNHGYGYPVANFLYPGFMYLGIPLKLIGLSYVDVIKTLFALSMIFSILGMYLWLRIRFDRFVASIGALFYLYLPYHLYDLTVRGSLGELLTLSIVPFLMLTLERRMFVTSSLLTSLLILSHNTLAVLFLPMLYGFVFLVHKKQKKDVILPLIFGILLASFFWLPAIFELSLTVFSQSSISSVSDYFAPLRVIGITLLGVIVLGVVSIIQQKKVEKPSGLILTVLAATVFLSSSASAMIWNFLPGQFIQFPFRLLSISLFAGSFVTAYFLSKNTYRVPFGIVFVLLLFATNSYFFPQGYDYYEDGFYSTNQATTTVKDEYMPIWVKNVPTKNPEKIASARNGIIVGEVVESNSIQLNVDLMRDEDLTIQRIYYPGWRATVDGQEVDVMYSNPEGLIEIPVKKGQHSVRVTFGETPFRLFADMLSGLTLLFLFGYAIIRKRR